MEVLAIFLFSLLVRLPFMEYFKPINYARSTGIGSTIMGIALMIGMLVTPYAEEAFGLLSRRPSK